MNWKRQIVSPRGGRADVGHVQRIVFNFDLLISRFMSGCCDLSVAFRSAKVGLKRYFRGEAVILLATFALSLTGANAQTAYTKSALGILSQFRSQRRH